MLGVLMGQCTSEAKRCRITLNLMSFSFVIRTRGDDPGSQSKERERRKKSIRGHIIRKEERESL